MNFEHTIHWTSAHRLARRALYSFLLTFVASRSIILLIMAHEIPNLYLFLQSAHIHHLNLGVLLLAGVAGYGIFFRPAGTVANLNAVAYGCALGLTFDEFGMWLNLDGGYWQRASIDAIIVISGVFGLLVFSRSIERYEARHFWSFIFLLLGLCVFGFVVFAAGNDLGELTGPRLRELELMSSP